MAEGSFSPCVPLGFGRILEIEFEEEATFLGAWKCVITVVFSS